MLNFSFGLGNKLPLLAKYYLTVYNYINATLLFRRLLNKESREKLFSALDSFWLKHGKTDWYSSTELKIIVGMIAEALSDNKLSAREIKVLITYIVNKWNPEIAKTKSVDNQLLEIVEPAALKAVEVYRAVNQSIDVIKYVKEVSDVISDNMSEMKLITYVKDTFSL
jgi:hypothetical protein